MIVTAVRFRRPVEGPDGKPLERLGAAVLKDGLVRAGSRRYPLHMVESFDVDACPVCGDVRPETAKGETCGSRSCVAKRRGTQPVKPRRKEAILK